MKNCMGITLIELIAVVSVLGVLLLIAVPNIFAINQHWILETTAREIVEDIRWAQHLAIVEGESYNFEIHLSDKYYHIRPNSSIGPSLKTVELDSCIVQLTSTLPRAGYSGEFFDYRVLTYTSTGNPGQTGSIVLKTRDGNSVSIRIAVGSGRAKIVR